MTAALDDKLCFIKELITHPSNDPGNDPSSEEQALRALQLWIWVSEYNNSTYLLGDIELTSTYIFQLTKAMVTRSAQSGREMMLKVFL